jgi:hypothetical protein
VLHSVSKDFFISKYIIQQKRKEWRKDWKKANKNILDLRSALFCDITQRRVAILYHSTLRNIPEERRSHPHRSGSLKSRLYWIWRNVHIIDRLKFRKRKANIGSTQGGAKRTWHSMFKNKNPVPSDICTTLYKYLFHTVWCWRSRTPPAWCTTDNILLVESSVSI